MIDNEKMAQAAEMVADAIGVDPAAMLITGREGPGGMMEVRFVILPDTGEEETPDQAEMRRKVDEAFSD